MRLSYIGLVVSLLALCQQYLNTSTSRVMRLKG